jgi:hypothetical protein
MTSACGRARRTHAAAKSSGHLFWRICPVINTEQMGAFLAQVSAAHPEDFIVMVVDGASSHVAQAKSRDRQATTIDVVKGAVVINPAAAPHIVGAIARAAPDLAPIAAGAAAAEQPRQAGAIAKAAAAAAPSKAGKTVVAVCRAVPSDYRNIVVAVFEAVPGSSNEIVKAVAAALPELRPGIEQVLAGYSRNFASPGALTPVVRGPASAPPYFPLTVTPTNVTTVYSGEDPPGGRNYATP